MNVKRIAWIGVSSLAVASWFSAASTPDTRVPAAAPPAPPSRALEVSAADMQAEIARLHERLAPTAVPSRSRDLFRFAGPRRPVPAPQPVAAKMAADVSVVTAPPPPALRLIGVAEDATADAITHTAIVAGLGDLFLVKAGEHVGPYLVDAVSADAVQLTDTTTAATVTLALR